MAGWCWVRRAAVATVWTVFMGVAVIDCASQVIAGGVPRSGILGAVNARLVQLM
jgi:hypothetical protein